MARDREGVKPGVNWFGRCHNMSCFLERFVMSDLFGNHGCIDTIWSAVCVIIFSSQLLIMISLCKLFVLAQFTERAVLWDER